MLATLVGDPGAEEYFQGVALTRCKGTVTPEDEATAEHLVDELKKLATKMGRLLACLRLTTTCGGGQEALVDVKRRIKVGEHEGGQPRYRERSMTEPFVARVTGVGPDSVVTPLCAVQGKTEFYKIVGGAKGKELTHHVLACEILLGHKAPLEDVRMNGINLSAYRVCSRALNPIPPCPDPSRCPNCQKARNRRCCETPGIA